MNETLVRSRRYRTWHDRLAGLPGAAARACTGNMATMRLTHVTVKNWRNFKEADFDLRDRMFVIGPNASGKSNLLDALRFLRHIASAGGGFQDAVARRGGMARIRCLAARNFNHGRVTLRIAIGDGSSPARWTYEVTFTAEPRGRHRPILKKEIVTSDGHQLLARPNDEDKTDPERMTQTHLEQVNANREFRPIVDFLRSIRYLHLVPHLIRDPERGADRIEDPYGADFLLRMAETPKKTRVRRLQQINQALRIAVPQLDELALVQDEIGRWHLQAGYKHWRPRLAVQNERDFSDGTLRLIGLLWSLLSGSKSGGPVLLEEPELSLHASVVRQLPAILNRVRRSGGPQVLLTTHSNEVLADEDLDTDEVVILKPGEEGTEAQTAGSLPDIEALRECELSLAEILSPRTEPDAVDELPKRIAQK